MAKSDGSKGVTLPTINLDRTLSDLYREHCPSLAHQKLGHIFCGTTSAADLSPDFPPNRKYVYQDSAFNDSSRAQKSSFEVQRALAPKYLSLVPQRDTFIAGDCPVIFFHSRREKKEMEHDRSEAEKTLAVLDPQQRPEVIFVAGPRNVADMVAEKAIYALTSKLILDQVTEAKGVKMLVHPDTQWHLNSKEALSRSGLPTPDAEIIEVEGYCPAASNCCETCEAAASDGNTFVPVNCDGPRNRWLGEQSLRILTAIERQTLPFVFKNQQAFAGAGTYVVTKGPERNRLLEEMTSGGILRRMLSMITEKNEHLRPGTVLLTKMVKDPVADYGVTFFVGESGESIFLAASEQMIDRENASWVGSKIFYSNQEALRQKFGPLLDQITAYLHKQSYFGPAGVDILETQSGTLQIVDLNVRTSGSFCLPLLQTHFTSRGFHCASSLSVTAKESRDKFCEQWRREVESGQMCILAWYEDGSSGKSFGDVVVGAEDEEALARMLEKVREATDQVTF